MTEIEGIWPVSGRCVPETTVCFVWATSKFKGKIDWVQIMQSLGCLHKKYGLLEAKGHKLEAGRCILIGSHSILSVCVCERFSLFCHACHLNYKIKNIFKLGKPNIKF